MATLPFLPEHEADLELFNGEPGHTFWVGKVAVGNIILRPESYQSLLQFRGDVYVNELGYLGAEALDSQGREKDLDDDRSVLFAAAENISNPAQNGNSTSQIKIVGSSRLIMKQPGTGKLPIEKHFPEVADRGVESETSAEISRFIARHPEKKHQRLLSLSLVRAMVNYCANEGILNTYAMMEKPLVRTLGMAGLPMDDLGEPRYVEELKGTLHPVVFYPQEILQILESTDDPRKERLTQFLGNVLEDGVNGYYPLVAGA